MNKITFVVDVCCNNVQGILTEDIADNLLAFSAAGIDVQFLCLPSQYQYMKQTLLETQAKSTFVKVVTAPTIPSEEQISHVLAKNVRVAHTHAFYCDLQTVTDDDIIAILDSQFLDKLTAYVGNKLVWYNGDGIFFGGAVRNLSAMDFTKKYNPRDKSKNNVKNLLKKIKTGK